MPIDQEKVVALLAGVTGDYSMARRIENALWIEWGHTPQYRNRLRMFVANLRNVKRNPNWTRRVLNGEIPLNVAVRQSPREIFPELYYDADQKVYEKERLLGKKEETRTVSGEPCRKCRSRNTTYTLMQTRCADEGATEYWFCRDCGKRWKGGG